MRISRYRVWSFCLVVLGALLSTSSLATVSTGIDESAQLSFWQWRSEGMSIRWVQRLPDQSRAFFAARQFNARDVEHIANSCVFQTIYKNTAEEGADTVIEYDMANWKVLPKNLPANASDASLGSAERLPQGVRLKKHWLREWEKRHVSPAAAIAFEWALLPTRHRLLAGDYNWGMTTFGLMPGESFDLQIMWRVNGKRHTAVIQDMQCAEDIQQPIVAPVVE